MDVTFLYAARKLVKTITRTASGEIRKTPYPNAKNFTSETVEVSSLSDFYTALTNRALDKRKPCLLKGLLNRPLVDESRRNSTTTNDRTQFLVLDPDEAPFASAEELMRALKLSDISYIVQYSSSYKLGNTKKLSAHIFVMLDRPLPAPSLKAWLMQMNLEVPVLKKALTLSNSMCALKWPLDITSCQNDRLIYIAEPEFIGMKSPVKPTERIQFVKKQFDRLDVSKLSERPIDALKKEARTELIRLQTDAGMTPLRTRPKAIGEHIVQGGVAEVTQYEIVDEDEEFVRMNLNGGNSAAYWHYQNDFELLHNFKGEDSVRLKEILPEYYKELVQKRKEKAKHAKERHAKENESPSEEGDQILCFRDKNTGAYWNGTFNPGTRKLDLFPAKNERQCEHFMMSCNRDIGDFIPIWSRIFDPTSDEVVNYDNRTINMWAPSTYIKNFEKMPSPSLKNCPIIQRIIDSAVGTGPIQEHFLNWLAVIAQHRVKPGTAWVLHGGQGTGKGLIVNKILGPILGEQYVAIRLQNELKGDFSSFLEFALVAFIDEIEVDSLDEGGIIEAKLKYYITEPTVPIRRMRMDSYSVPSYTGWIFGSNKNKPVIIPRNDRRYNVGQFQPRRLQITQEEVEVGIKSELQAFTNYLMSRKADREVARVPLMTEDRETLMALSETSLERTANAILTGDLESLYDAKPDEKLIDSLHQNSVFAIAAQAYLDFLNRALSDAVGNKETRLTRDQLGMIFQHCVGNVPTSPNKLTSFLGHLNIELKRLRDPFTGSPAQAIDVKWNVTKEFLAATYKPPAKQPRTLRAIQGTKR